MAGAQRPTFVIYRELGDGYRWRLRAPSGETIAASEAGHAEKPDCEKDLRRLRGTEYPGAAVLDSTARGPEQPGRGTGEA